MMLDNSKRSLLRATYTPFGRKPKTDGSGMALEKWRFFGALRATATEAEEVIAKLSAQAAAERKRLLARLARHARVDDTSAAWLAEVPDFSDMPASLLIDFGAELVRLRQRTRESGLAALSTIVRARNAANLTKGSTMSAAVPADFQIEPKFAHPAFRGASLYRLPLTALRPAELSARADGVRGSKEKKAAARGFRLAARVVPPSESAATSIAASSDLDRISDLVGWARARPDLADEIAAVQRAAALVPRGDQLIARSFEAASLRFIGTYVNEVSAFDRLLLTEPLGYLHLERITFTPAGIERGELVHSVPLTPGEEVNIAHKEWARTADEFERIVNDYLEQYSEQGVAEKNDLSLSTTSQEQHSRGFSLGVTASGSYGPVSISTSTNFNVNDSASESEQLARRHSVDLTRKASSRVRQEHKVSFKAASAAGTEDQTVRKIRNPHPDRSVRADYYQLVRKWQVDLYRYGVRLTYDLVIPEPGSDMLSRISEIAELTAALRSGFGDPVGPAWARFDLVPQSLTPENYMAHAAFYGAPVKAPAEAQLHLHQAFSKNFTEEEREQDLVTRFEMQVPDGYLVSGYEITWFAWQEDEDDMHFAVRAANPERWIGAEGTIPLSADTKRVSSFDIEVDLFFTLKDSIKQEWQLQTWATLRQAAEQRFQETSTRLRDRLAQLQADLGGQDALSVRQAEREEIMKGVLRWMFGPDFVFAPPANPAQLYNEHGSVVDSATWARTLVHGEIVRFLHQAIEWENLLYFLYPYFWSHPDRWELKKYLDHPDLGHRSFLRAGSARVVLTIRPGFEKAFLALRESGALGGVPQGPYLSIAEEVEAFARTNYPGIRPANPVEDARPLLSPRQRKAWEDMSAIIALLERAHSVNGRYPTTAEGLAALLALGHVPTSDPWGRPYQYSAPGTYTDYELASLGADAALDGEEEAADITSWAEASLIGRWYDYTPTPALDVAFADVLPSA